MLYHGCLRSQQSAWPRCALWLRAPLWIWPNDALEMGNDALALLQAAGRDGWRARLSTLKVAHLDGLAVRLAMEGKFEGKKGVKQALLMPAVEEWWAEQPETCEASQNNG